MSGPPTSQLFPVAFSMSTTLPAAGQKATSFDAASFLGGLWSPLPLDLLFTELLDFGGSGESDMNRCRSRLMRTSHVCSNLRQRKIEVCFSHDPLRVLVPGFLWGLPSYKTKMGRLIILFGLYCIFGNKVIIKA